MQHTLKRLGFFKEKINPLSLSNNTLFELDLIKQNFASLPKDPYAEKTVNRFRAYSNLILLPWKRHLFWIPTENKQGQHVSSYWQGHHNPEHQNKIRYFTPLDSEVKHSVLLKNLILHDFDLTFWQTHNYNFPLHIGVHFVKLLVLSKAHRAISSPNCMHRDGEAFTFAHLFTRYNIKGGKNYVAGPEWANHTLDNIPEGHLKAKFELREPFATYAVCDALVSHYVSPVELNNKALSFGYREIILIDFSPMQQHLL